VYGHRQWQRVIRIDVGRQQYEVIGFQDLPMTSQVHRHQIVRATFVCPAEFPQPVPQLYLSRAIDRDGNLIETMLSPTRDMKAARRFFRSARSVAGFVPDRVTTDGHHSYPRAIRSTLGRDVRHRTNVYLNNRLEQDHCGIKGRIRCMCGFKGHDAAERFCREHDELRNFLRSRSRHNHYVPAARRRRRFLRHAGIATRIMQLA
jgi:hypothetical protein